MFERHPIRNRRRKLERKNNECWEIASSLTRTPPSPAETENTMRQNMAMKIKEVEYSIDGSFFVCRSFSILSTNEKRINQFRLAHQMTTRPIRVSFSYTVERSRYAWSLVRFVALYGPETSRATVYSVRNSKVPNSEAETSLAIRHLPNNSWFSLMEFAAIGHHRSNRFSAYCSSRCWCLHEADEISCGGRVLWMLKNLFCS
jgi:hypothetical protein